MAVNVEINLFTLVVLHRRPEARELIERAARRIHRSGKRELPSARWATLRGNHQVNLVGLDGEFDGCIADVARTWRASAQTILADLGIAEVPVKVTVNRTGLEEDSAESYVLGTTSKLRGLPNWRLPD